jgi:hypothetical protein
VLGVAVLVAINDSAHGVNLLANFQDQRRFLVIAALLGGACAAAMGAVRIVQPASQPHPSATPAPAPAELASR